MGPYLGEDTGGCCWCGVGITGGGYTIGCDCGREPRILPEYARLGTTVSGVECPDCSTSSAQDVNWVDLGGCCGVCSVVTAGRGGGGCDTGAFGRAGLSNGD